jgi:predicted lipoprotein with Yx(FWY)xxD motif
MVFTRSSSTSRVGRVFVLLVVGVIALAACSKDSSKSVSAGSGAGSNGGSGATVLVRSTSHGSVLTDDKGKTLYTYDQDAAGATSSACTGGCATAWPPLTATGTPVAGPGVTGTLAKIAGDQVTLDGHPLYRWMSDNAPGDVTGDGVNGFHAALAKASAAATTSSSSGSSY